MENMNIKAAWEHDWRMKLSRGETCCRSLERSDRSRRRSRTKIFSLNSNASSGFVLLEWTAAKIRESCCKPWKMFATSFWYCPGPMQTNEFSEFSSQRTLSELCTSSSVREESVDDLVTAVSISGNRGFESERMEFQISALTQIRIISTQHNENNRPPRNHSLQHPF